MNYNYDENDIINEMLDLNDINIIYYNLQEIIYNLVIVNDSDNILEIIDEYGGFNDIYILYENKYKYTSLLDIDKENKLNNYNKIAFIGMFDYIFNKISSIINTKNNIDDLCDQLNLSINI
jgi:hypothetical protein